MMKILLARRQLRQPRISAPLLSLHILNSSEMLRFEMGTVSRAAASHRYVPGVAPSDQISVIPSVGVSHTTTSAGHVTPTSKLDLRTLLNKGAPLAQK